MGVDKGVDKDRDKGADRGKDIGVDVGEYMGVNTGVEMGRGMGKDMGSIFGRPNMSFAPLVEPPPASTIIAVAPHCCVPMLDATSLFLQSSLSLLLPHPAPLPPPPQTLPQFPRPPHTSGSRQLVHNKFCVGRGKGFTQRHR